MALLSNILTVQWIVAQFWQFLVRQPKCTAWASSSLFMRYQAERVSVLIKRFGCACARSPEVVGVVPSLHCRFVDPPVECVHASSATPTIHSWRKWPHLLIHWNLGRGKIANMIYAKNVKLRVHSQSETEVKCCIEFCKTLHKFRTSPHAVKLQQ